MTVIAGIDVGNATTEVVLVSGGKILGAGRAPTRGRKGSPGSLRGAAALVRRLERQLGVTVTEGRIAPLRAVDTAVVSVPDAAAPAGRLRVLAAGVPTPGGTGACVGVPLSLSAPAPGDTPAPDDIGPDDTGPDGTGPDGTAVVAVVPSGLRYGEAAARLQALLAAGTPVGAVLVAGDEGVLVANRLPRNLIGGLPVIDQVDAVTAAACRLLAVEVRPPGHTLRLLADPVALGARLGLAEGEAGDAVTVSRALADHPNAVVGLLPAVPDAPAVPDEPWVMTAGEGRLTLRAACPRLAGWPVGAVSAFGTGAVSGADSGAAEVDDLFAVDLAAAAQAATARQGSTGRAVLVASLSRAGEEEAASVLRGLLDVPVHSPLSEPAAARLGALTTPGARDDAVVVDLGAGTIDVTGPGGTVVAAGAGELLTAAVAEMLAIPRASADWVKRGPCVRVDGGQRFEGEDGSRGFLDVPAPASAAGMLVVEGPGGWLPFDRHRGPGEWRAIRLRLKQAVLAANFGRAVRTLGRDPAQVLVVGGPAGDEELLGVLSRSLPDGVAAGRGDVGGTCPGASLGHRYAVALGLALAPLD
ncbi:MAG TPA: diol dehydratase reactivase ATPase-like domain-containing protein [Streptosporangiaceae bacterium]|nr:diol dehydratase reactivase ATPase-like domain-containing protein [Streptosporangiaceae bacterium]